MERRVTDRAISTPAIFDKPGVMGRLDGDEDLFRELLVVFREEYPSLDTALTTAVTQRDNAAVTLNAHSLKGALGNVGAARAQEAAKQLECAGRAGEVARYEGLVQGLRAEVAQYLSELIRSGY